MKATSSGGDSPSASTQGKDAATAKQGSVSAGSFGARTKSEGADVTKGKYYLIEVPNFNDSEESPMTSYLRLGAVKETAVAGKMDAPKETGEDLAAYVTSFIDDTRARKNCDETGEFSFIPEDTRVAESEILHTKGGWRDHSDGNRITTTRGDKVEVVRGNYKMVVLGRTDREQDAAVVDISGGHITDNPITFRTGYENLIEWVENYDGTWKVVESIVRGDVTSSYHGDTRDFYTGKLKESTTGSEAPEKFAENPAITDRTWAASIASYTGSAALPIPTMHDETWATSVTSYTNVTTSTSTTEAVSLTDSTTATSITSTTTAASVASTTTAVVTDLQIGPTTSTIIGADTEIIVGAETSVTVGATVDVMVGAKLSVELAGGVEIAAGPTLSITCLHADYQVLCTEIKSLRTELASASNKVAGAFNWLAGVIHLG